MQGVLTARRDLLAKALALAFVAVTIALVAAMLWCPCTASAWT